MSFFLFPAESYSLYEPTHQLSLDDFDEYQIRYNHTYMQGKGSIALAEG